LTGVGKKKVALHADRREEKSGSLAGLRPVGVSGGGEGEVALSGAKKRGKKSKWGEGGVKEGGNSQ